MRLRPVALGRKNFFFVGSECSGHAAAIYYSLVESFKVNPPANVRKKFIMIQAPDKFTVSNIALVG